MNQQFFHIASVNFHHEYKGDGRFDGFLAEWSSEAGLLMGNLQLLIKPFFGGFHVMCSDPELLKGEHDPILIRILPKDSLFFNFTDFGEDFRPNSKVFHFSDRNANLTGGNLHPKDFVSIEDSFDVLNQNTLKELLSGLSGGGASLRDSQDNPHLPEDYTRYFLEKVESVFYIDRGKSSQGFYKSNQGMDKVPFGLVSIVPDNLYWTYRNEGSNFAFQIRFKTRKTFWKYILSDKVFDKFSRLTVIDAQNKEILFKEGEFEIQPAWKVRCFESEVEIPFIADFYPRFQLVEKSKDENQAGKVIYKQLPKASPEQLHPLPTNKEVLFSHIFI